jgi:uncharacterized protein involved in response to NO
LRDDIGRKARGQKEPDMDKLMVHRVERGTRRMHELLDRVGADRAALAWIRGGDAHTEARMAILRPDILPPSGALHAWTVGAVGTMTLAVMTRASLGHTGKPLTASGLVQAIYVAVIFSAFARMLAGFGIARDPMMHLSAGAWIFAFSAFATIFTPLLARRRAS